MHFQQSLFLLILFLFTHVLCELEGEVEYPYSIRPSELDEEKEQMYNNLYHVTIWVLLLTDRKTMTLLILAIVL